MGISENGYVKYQHVEKIGSDEVDGIMLGDVFVFPKLDGTNAHVWFDGEQMRYGSRRRELSIDNDNADFMATLQQDKSIEAMCRANPNTHIFGS